MNFIRRISGIIILCELILIIGLPRLPDLDRFVTPDERLWLERSGWFYYALAHRDFSATFQQSHPGVTVMWAGLTGYVKVYPRYQENFEEKNRPVGLGTLAQRDYAMPLRILIESRRTMVLLHMLALGFGFLFARRLFGTIPALVGFLLIAFDPFHIALSRVLHLDGLLADFMLLSLLAFLAYLEDNRNLTLVISGAAAGLAWLTKSPGLFLIPLIGLLILFNHLRSKNNPGGVEWRKSIPQILKVATIWGAVGLLVFFIFWPAMWVDPIGSIVRVVESAIGYAEAGHESAVFFNGKIYANGEIPDISFYPINFLWRTTPVILLGLVALFVSFIYNVLVLRSGGKVRALNPNLLGETQTDVENTQQDWERQIWILAKLLFFAIAFAALMSLGLKKFDRYIMASIVVMDLMAGVGLAWLATWVEQIIRKKWGRILSAAILLSTITFQAVLAWSVFPYYFSYYNPLMGGGRQAVEVMQIGWGEGLDEAARYINSKPNSEKLRVMSWYGTGSFSYLSKSQVIGLEDSYSGSIDNWAQFNKSDYIVIYIHEWQRNLPAEVLERLRNQTPEYSVWINGLEYVRVYKLR